MQGNDGFGGREKMLEPTRVTEHYICTWRMKLEAIVQNAQIKRRGIRFQVASQEGC